VYRGGGARLPSAACRHRRLRPLPGGGHRGDPGLRGYRLESRYIAAAEPYEGEAAREALGPAADPRAFLFTRPFITDVVRIDLDDLADPHPYWLVSTRRPKDLAAALRALPAKEVTVR